MPEYYRDASAETAITDTRALVDFIRAMPGNETERVRPAIRPRFVPACTDTEALDRAGLLGRPSVLAHGNCIGPADVALIRARGSISAPPSGWRWRPVARRLTCPSACSAPAMPSTRSCCSRPAGRQSGL